MWMWSLLGMLSTDISYGLKRLFFLSSERRNHQSRVKKLDNNIAFSWVGNAEYGHWASWVRVLGLHRRWVGELCRDSNALFLCLGEPKSSGWDEKLKIKLSVGVLSMGTG